MRKYVRDEILQLTASLYEAHEEIKNAIEKGEFSLTQNMLSECQECAIHIGSVIERSEGEGFVTVSYLEKYCETLFHVYEALQEGIRAEKAFKLLRQGLLLVENSVKNDIPIRKEVVFFPYKASMWDALESIYLKLKEEDTCDVYCVPIPYFERNADQSLGKMHYEGREYPANIEVFDWKSYKLEERRPDVVYIHNPYDEWNLVTCVHPDYFSSNLKKYTSELIYIPYFILDEIEPSNHVAVAGMKHFCYLPGVLNADKVILQSENMRQIYINEYTKALQENGIKVDKKETEAKFIGSGSPKVEKILNLKKTDLDIPDEWIRIIEKSDGSWKKIVFYNISINAFLKNSDSMLEKIKSVLAVFKEQKDEIALLWRPHPLIPTTIKSLRLELWLEYNKIVEQYKQEGWGIYDDTADMPRAVVLSDAYYGDTSSVLRLYKKTGKPIVMQDVSVKAVDAPMTNVPVENAVLEDGKIWFSAMDFNGLFEKNIETGEVHSVGMFPDEPYAKTRLYIASELVGRKIYFAPFKAENIAVFDLEEQRFKRIVIDSDRLDGKSNITKYTGTALCGKYLYMLPTFSSSILRIDTENDTVEYITGWKEKVRSFIFDEDMAFFRGQSVEINNKLFIPFANVNAVLELDLITLQTTVHRIGTESVGYSGICYDGYKFWLSPRKFDHIVSWNMEQKYVENIMVTYQENKGGYPFVGIAYHGGKVLPYASIDGVSVSTEENKVVIPNGEHLFVKENGNQLMFYEKNSGQLTIIDKVSNQRQLIDIRVNATDIDVQKLITNENGETAETPEKNLCHLLKYLL